MKIKKYNYLKERYGNCASWAIWDTKVQSRTTIIEENINNLHSNYVFIGLNISQKLNFIPWSNFHGGKHDRKIKYACNHTTLRGSYITDLFKDLEEVSSSKITKKLMPRIIKHNVDNFIQEMHDVGIKDTTVFVLFGGENSVLGKLYKKYFMKHFGNKVIFYKHYSYYGITDEKWVNGLWQHLGINASLRT